MPNEIELAEHFNVSRSTMRSALQTLEKVGFVVRKRGIGTFVSDEPLKANNLSLNWGVTQVIRSIGAKPGSLETVVAFIPADKYLAERLHVNENTSLLFVERVRTADDRRVVFTQDYVIESLINQFHTEDPIKEIEEFLKEHYSLYRFLEQYMLKTTHHAIARISPIPADEFVANKLEIPVGSGILYLEQVDYDHEGDPYWLAKEFHVANAFAFTVYRSN